MSGHLKRAATFLTVFALCQWVFQWFAADAAALRSIALSSMIATAVFAALMALTDRMKRSIE